jgi:hypothetical protein
VFESFLFVYGAFAHTSLTVDIDVSVLSPTGPQYFHDGHTKVACAAKNTLSTSNVTLFGRFHTKFSVWAQPYPLNSKHPGGSIAIGTVQYAKTFLPILHT